MDDDDLPPLFHAIGGHSHSASLPALEAILSTASSSVGTCGVNQMLLGITTPLITASLQGKAGAVGLLLRAPGILVNKRDSEGRTAVLVAAMEDHLECLRLLLEEGGASVNKADALGQTPLCVAAMEGSVRCFQMLLGAKRIKASRASACGVTPLIAAAATAAAGNSSVGHGGSNEEGSMGSTDSTDSTDSSTRSEGSTCSARCLALLLCSGKITIDDMQDAISYLEPYTPSMQRVTRARHAQMHAQMHAPLKAPAEVSQEGDVVGAAAEGRGIGTALLASPAPPPLPLAMSPSAFSLHSLPSSSPLVSSPSTPPSDPPSDPPSSPPPRRRSSHTSPLCPGSPLDVEESTALYLIPLLEAELEGKRRWCGWCLCVTPWKDMPTRCEGCRSVVYCSQQCRANHWEGGEGGKGRTDENEGGAGKDRCKDRGSVEGSVEGMDGGMEVESRKGGGGMAVGDAKAGGGEEGMEGGMEGGMKMGHKFECMALSSGGGGGGGCSGGGGVLRQGGQDGHRGSSGRHRRGSKGTRRGRGRGK